MNADLVLPHGNEAELIESAKTLGFKEIVLVYSQLSTVPKKLPDHSRGIKVKKAVFASNANEIAKIRSKVDAVVAPAERHFFENKGVDFVVGAEGAPQKDFFYQKRGGIDDAMCRLAKQNGISIVFDARSVEGKNWLGRFQQNARLCRKHKVNSIVATLASDPLGMRSSLDIDAFKRAIKLV